jgi:hypothetical protein
MCEAYIHLLFFLFWSPANILWRVQNIINLAIQFYIGLFIDLRQHINAYDFNFNLFVDALQFFKGYFQKNVAKLDIRAK